MRICNLSYRIAVTALLLACAPSAMAGIISVYLGSGSPPSSLGPFTLTSFGTAGDGGLTPISSLATPLGGQLAFSTDLLAAQVGSDWFSWSHDYFGLVYWTNAEKSITLTMSSLPVTAFLFYAQPNPTDIFDITASTQNGATLTQAISGNGGASGFGFYTPDGDLISSITITSTEDFAIGEFAIARTSVPEPGTLMLLCTGFCFLILPAYRNKRTN